MALMTTPIKFPYQKQEFDKALLLLEGTVVANNPL